MKKMKLAAVVAAFAASLGFTSCLDGSGTGGTMQGTFPFKVVTDYMTGNTIFEDAVGNEYKPITPVVMGEGTPTQFAQVYFSYDMEQMGTQKQIPITVLGNPEYIPAGKLSEEAVPAGMVSVSGILEERNGGRIVWENNDYLILYPTFKVHKSTNVETLKDELKKHVFTLYYDLEGATDDKILKLSLRYQIAGVSTDEDLKEYSVSTSYPAYFDLRSVIARYEGKTGVYPEKVEIEYETSYSFTPTVNEEQKNKQRFTLNLQPKHEGEI